MADPCGEFTVSGDPEIEKYIGNVLDDIIKSIIDTCRPKSIILTGSASRGEMTAYKCDGGIKVVSDFEIGVVLPLYKYKKLRALAKEMKCRYDFDVSLLFMLPRRFTKLKSRNFSLITKSLRLEHYDILSTGKVLYGIDYSKIISRFSFSDVPLEEFHCLFFNRTIELMNQLSKNEKCFQEIFKCSNKLLISACDYMLAFYGRYDSSYAKRLEEIDQMEINVDKAQLQMLKNAYKFKLGMLSPDVSDLNVYVKEALGNSILIFEQVIDKAFGICKISNPNFFCSYYNAFKRRNAEICLQLAECLDFALRAAVRHRWKPFYHFSCLHPYHIIYCEVVELFFIDYYMLLSSNGLCKMPENYKCRVRDISERWHFFCKV